MGLADLFRRDTVKDPFGGEDGFDGESRFAGKGPKIALAASGALFLLLVGGVTAVVLTGEDAPPPPVLGSLSDLQVVEDTAEAPHEAAPAASAPKAPVVADATAATDMSVERRPWLNATPSAPADNAPRPGMTAKPSASATPPPAPAKTAAATPPPVAPAAPLAKPAGQTPMPPVNAVIKPTEPPAAKPAESKVAVMTPPPAAPTAAAKPGAPTSLTPPAPTVSGITASGVTASGAKPDVKSGAKFIEPMPADEEVNPARDIGGIPALRASGEAPGAPRRFDAPAGDGQAAVAGGRPRLVEPPLPPTDKVAVAAPPPRYANLTDVKRDAGKETPPAATATKVAFIVDGLGLSQTATDAAINKLPAAVTLAFSPYARNLKSWMEKAKAKGHEVLIEVPMESKQFPADDPGPLGLLTSLEAKENTERLDTILKESSNAVGVLDVTGSKFRESSEHINPVFAKLKASNLFYVQGEPGVRTGEATVPTAIADLIIDERPFRAAIDARLDYAERLAKYQGSAVAAMSAKPVSFERLVLWIEQARKKGIVLAPMSQVLIKQ